MTKSLSGLFTLAEAEILMGQDQICELALVVQGSHIHATIDGRKVFDLIDREEPLKTGAIALIIDEGRMASVSVMITPL